MRQKPSGRPSSSEQIIRDIKRKTRKQYNAEEKIISKYTERKLADDIERLARKINPTYICQYNQENRETVISSQVNSNEEICRIFLGNMLLKVQALQRKERVPAIEAILCEYLTPSALSSDEFLASLSLRVRTKFEAHMRRMMFSQKYGSLPESVHVDKGELLIEIVADRAESIRSVSAEDLSSAHVTVDETVRIASASLRRATDDNQWKAIETGIWLSTYQDDYDFARIVAAENHARFPIDSHPIVFAPSHSICLVTAQMNTDTLERTIAIGNELASSHRPFSQLLWSMSPDGQWGQWCPEGESAVKHIADRQNMLERMSEYHGQQKYLQAIFGKAVFVASFMSVGKEDQLGSICVYTVDIPSCLPVTDDVALNDRALPGDESFLGKVTWSDFTDCIGTELQKVADDLMLPYFTIMKEPTPAQLDALRSRVIEF